MKAETTSNSRTIETALFLLLLPLAIQMAFPALLPAIIQRILKTAVFFRPADLATVFSCFT